MSTYQKRSSYGIFVRFRRSRLVLRRGVTELADAIAIAEELRANRFHDRGDVFLVKEPEGTIVELPVLTPEAPEAPEAPEQAAPPELPAPPLRPSEAPARTSRPPAAKPELARILQLGEQVDHLRRALERARAARDRFVRALALAEGASRTHDASAPSAAFRRNQEGLGPLLAVGAQTLASVERISAVVERRLQRAWAEATGSPIAPLLLAAVPAGHDGASAAARSRLR